MRTVEEYREILDLWDFGESKKGIARITGIPRGTVADCIKRFGSVEELEAALAKEDEASLRRILEDATRIHDSDIHKAYAYMLGLYLGDGCITKPKGQRVYTLRISLDTKYPGIIKASRQALQTLFPNNRIGVDPQRGNWVNVRCCYKHWPVLLPQHGAGPKHKREIALEDWQQRIVDAYPLEFFRGLYHSDGSRSQNIVKGRDYPRYQFSNFSPDIRRMFCETCDVLGLHWTVASRRNICISRREDVAHLDRVIGPKT